MNCIVAVDKNWAIGYQNKLLARIPEDQRFFRETTTGKVVILGRKTLETFPGGKPLKNRVNIVITTRKDYRADDAIVVRSIEEALAEAAKYNSEDVFVIGGDSVYRQMLSFCDVAYVTRIDHEYQADTYFPNLDLMDDWALVEISEEYSYQGLTYRFCRYERKKTK
ncbi:MAG: dihydrofolate reductase [Clostridiales bacterium]|nr:dihydrofolate reductase [Clostridiales bacterium]